MEPGFCTPHGASYRHDALAEADLLEDESDRGADLRALVRGLARDPHPNDVLRNGAVPAADAAAFDAVYRSGRDELSSWITAGARQDLLDALAAGGERI